MVEPTTIIPLLNAQQQGMVGLAHGFALMPELAQASARELALQLLRQEALPVQKPESGKGSAQVDDGDDRPGSSSDTPRRERRRKGESPSDEASPSSSPLVGNLLNVKV